MTADGLRGYARLRVHPTRLPGPAQAAGITGPAEMDRRRRTGDRTGGRTLHRRRAQSSRGCRSRKGSGHSSTIAPPMRMLPEALSVERNVVIGDPDIWDYRASAESAPLPWFPTVNTRSKAMVEGFGSQIIPVSALIAEASIDGLQRSTDSCERRRKRRCGHSARRRTVLRGRSTSRLEPITAGRWATVFSHNSSASSRMNRVLSPGRDSMAFSTLRSNWQMSRSAFGRRNFVHFANRRLT